MYNQSDNQPYRCLPESLVKQSKGIVIGDNQQVKIKSSGSIY